MFMLAKVRCNSSPWLLFSSTLFPSFGMTNFTNQWCYKFGLLWRFFPSITEGTYPILCHALVQCHGTYKKYITMFFLLQIALWLAGKHTKANRLVHQEKINQLKVMIMMDIYHGLFVGNKTSYQWSSCDKLFTLLVSQYHHLIICLGEQITKPVTYFSNILVMLSNLS